MESKLTDDVGSLAAAASSSPLLVYDYEPGNPPEISQTVLSVANGSMCTMQVPEMCCEYRCLETPQGLVLMVDAVPGKAPTPRAIGEMAAVQGMFFYLDHHELEDVVGTLIILPGDPEPSLELVTFQAPLPTLMTDAQQNKATRYYLLESSKDLFLVCLFYIGFTFERVEEVGTYVMDFSKKEWCKVNDIGDAAFLLGPGGSAAEHGLKSGCIYLADDCLGDSNDFHIFDLKEGTRELVSPSQDIPALSRKPFWLVPVLP